jgi:hypothetical protein
MKRIFLIFLASLLMPEVSFATITLTNGQWSSTLNCADWQQASGQPWTQNGCDDMTNSVGQLCGGERSRINASGNYSGGGGGKGYRLYLCTGQFSNTDSLKLEMTSAVPELWFRWYARYASGISWNPFSAHKLMYDFNAKWIISLYDTVSLLSQGYGSKWHMAQHDTCTGGPRIKKFGWNQINGGSVGDGQFHSYEVHLKTDTNGSNGVFQSWVDGVLRNSHSDVNYGGQNFQGWSMGVNQATIGTPGFWDLDDLKISTNGYIGPLAGRGGDSTAPTVPMNPSATAVSSSQINFTWTTSTDEVGVTGYNVYRNGSLVATSVRKPLRRRT